MGIIRIILAIAVVLVHVGPIFGFYFIDGTIAVQSFFIISGFYISMVLTEKYNFPKSYKLFISNRLLRLFPTYMFIATITLFAALVFYVIGVKIALIYDWYKIDLFSKFYLIFINLFIIGQETTLFLAFNDAGTLCFSSDFQNSTPPVYTFLLSPPAWSLSLELLFYLLAPFLLKRKFSVILMVLFLSLSLRIILYMNGYFYDPWNYRFFPTELFFFLAGNISYRIYIMYKDSEKYKKSGLLVLILLLILIFTFNYIPITYYVKQWAFYILFIAAIPAIFNYTKQKKFDRAIGELSFPIYLSHIFILRYCLPIFNELFKMEHLNSVLTLIFTILFSILLNNYLIKPIEIYRSKRIASA